MRHALLRCPRAAARRRGAGLLSAAARPPQRAGHFFVDRMRQHAAREEAEEARVAVARATTAAAAAEAGHWQYEETATFALLLQGAAAVRARVRGVDGGVGEGRGVLGCLCRPGVLYCASMLAAWRLGKVFMPLQPQHPPAEVRYMVEDSGADVIVVADEERFAEHRAELERIDAHPLSLVDIGSNALLASASRANLEDEEDADAEHSGEQGALLMYTSGTTGRPKGVVLSNDNVLAMIKALEEAWEVTRDDYMLHFLPLHHMHGVLNNLLLPLHAGGAVEFQHNAAPETLLARLAAGELPAPTVFTAVPTVYARLLEMMETVQSATSDNAALEGVSITDGHVRDAMATLRTRTRVTISGSAALPAVVRDRWHTASGHVMLERYGMTETGMLLSHPLQDVSQRFPGAVGLPLPGVEVRLLDSNAEDNTDLGTVIDPKSGQPGELCVRGPNVFAGYLNRPDATAEAFTPDGWFRTGDIAQFDSQQGTFRLLGRSSVDILKSAGYKISALEVEREILEHEDVAEACVVGQTDAVWGEVVLAILRMKDGRAPLTIEALAAFLKPRLASYKRPRKVLVVPQIPKNLLGKINKKTVLDDLGESST